MAVSRTERAWATLAEVPDPEVPALSVRELGIVRDVLLHLGRQARGDREMEDVAVAIWHIAEAEGGRAVMGDKKVVDLLTSFAANAGTDGVRVAVVCLGCGVMYFASAQLMCSNLGHGNQAVIDASPFALGDSIASRIANQLNEADTPDFRSALVALGLDTGSTTTILGFNRPEWVIVNVATMGIGGAAAGIYTTCSPTEVQYIIHHAEATVVLVEDAAQFAKIAQERDKLPNLRHVVLMQGHRVDDPLALTWDQFLARGDATPDTAVDERVRDISPDATATYIYTSGTTGPPKAVMLSHHNVLWTADTVTGMMKFTHEDSMLSYLPLSHIAEQMFSVYLPITAGTRVYFAGGLDKLRETLLAARPTVFLGVPRVWEKLQAALMQKLAEASPIQRRVIAWARDVGTRAGRYRLESGKPFGLLALEEAVAQRLLFNKVKTAIGLDKVRVAVSGAAAIRKDVLDFFLSLGLPIYEVYGQSECAGPATSNASRAGETRLGTVGKAIPGTVVKLAEDGEILFQGPNLCAGYFKDPASTAAAIQDGWLHTGDVGELDDKGFLRITDRKKDLFKTSGGKYIAPQPLEGLLRAIPIVAQAVIIGENRKYVTALLTLDGDKAQAFAKERELPADLAADPERLAKHEKVLAFVQEHVDRMNKTLARYETVKRFTLLPRDFSVERGEMTPSQKLRRRAILTRYAAEIEAMYPETNEAGEG